MTILACNNIVLCYFGNYNAYYMNIYVSLNYDY